MNALSTAVNHQIPVGPFSTHYLTWGDPSREPVVLLHDGAFGGSASVSWSWVGPLLARDFFVIAPDMLGFGDTAKAVFVGESPYQFRIEHLAELLRVLGIGDPVHLVGTSFGGSIALRAIASDGPINVRTVTAVSGTGGPWRTPLALAELGRWDGTKNDLLRIVHLLMTDGPHLSDQLDRRYAAACTPGHYRAIKAAASPVPEALGSAKVHDPWPEQVSGRKTPVLLVAGKDDVLLDPGWPGHFESVLPNSTVVTLPGRHAPNVDAPENLVRCIREFIGHQR